jgi:hypothetical protein
MHSPVFISAILVSKIHAVKLRRQYRRHRKHYQD